MCACGGVVCVGTSVCVGSVDECVWCVWGGVSGGGEGWGGSCTRS
jgi:hypothetical protein